jgi:DNA-binding transcriptional MerR regulator
MAEGDYLQIGEVAALTGLTQRTLRYYEELQLLDPPTRMAGGFRLYSPADVARVRRILQIKGLLGFSLAEVKAILAAESAQARPLANPPDAADVRRRLATLDQVIANTSAQLDLITRKMAEMESLRTDLQTRLADLQARQATLQTAQDHAAVHASSEYA